MLVKKNFLLYVLIAIYASLLHSSSQQYMPARASTLAKRMNLALVGYVPPAMTKVAIQGDYAYVGAGPVLIVFGVAYPDYPVRLTYLLLRAFVNDLVVSGGFAYVLTSDNRVLIIDITQPNAPAIRGTYIASDKILDLSVEGSYLYLAVSDGLRIIDVTDPSNPQLIELFLSTYPFPIIVSGKYAYLPSPVFEEGYGYVKSVLKVLDISDLTNPVLISETYFDPYLFQAIATDGQVLVLAGYAEYLWGGYYMGLLFIDISDPTSPRLLKTFYCCGGYYCCGYSTSASIAISPGRVYFANHGAVYQVFDISDPENPNLVGYGVDPVEDLTSQGDFVYVAAGTSGFAIEDTSNPAQPVRRGLYDGIGDVVDVAAAAGVLYAADDGTGGGLVAMDVLQPYNAQVIGKSSQPAGAGFQVAIHENYAYLTVGHRDYTFYPKLPPIVTCTRGLQSFDVTHPESPATGGYLNMLPNGYIEGDIDFEPGEIVVSGTVALVADGPGLYVIDVTQPLTPTQFALYQFASTETAQGVAMNGPYALVAVQGAGLQVLDITSPITPTLVSTYPLTDAMDVVVHEQYAYVADGSQGVRVLNVSDVQHISPVGEVDTPGTANSLALDGQYLYVADGEAGVRMIDVSLPENPVEAGAYDTPGNAVDVAARGGRVYVADSSGGLFMFIPIPIQAYLPIIFH
jgi:hypothetical protein